MSWVILEKRFSIHLASNGFNMSTLKRLRLLKVAVATVVSLVLAGLTAISVSPSAIAARQAMLAAAANHTGATIVIAAVIGFLGTLYILRDINFPIS
jgi:hypothetical protein